MIVFSVSLTIGLQSLYISTRIAAAEVGSNNIHYSHFFTRGEPLKMEHANYNDENSNYLLRFVAAISESEGMWIQGINSLYLEKYETINLDKSLSSFSEQDLKEHIDDQAWNGIILPRSFISSRDIGRVFNTRIYNRDVSFNIVAGYYENDFSVLRCYVSNAFLEEILSIIDYSNTVFSLESSGIERTLVDYEVSTKDEIVNQSYVKVVKSTELIELSVGVVFIVSTLMLLNYIYLLSSQNKYDIIRFQALGLPLFRANRVYLYHILHTILLGLFVGIILARVLATSACYLTLSNYYYPHGIRYSKAYISIECFILLFFPVAAYILFIKSNNRGLLYSIRNVGED
jgi:hypothetical protein